jgi:nucleotide-binding universal stress UspA family protein
MSYLVAFDDNPLSRGALRKAVEYAEPTHQEVIVITIIPQSNVQYYRDKRWIDKRTERKQTAELTEATAEAISRNLRGRVNRIAPNARFEPIISNITQVTTRGIANQLRQAIRDYDPSDVFIGARDARAIVSALLDSSDTKYHLHMIRKPYIPSSNLPQYS